MTIVERESTIMDAEDYPETAAGPANDDTSIVDPSTQLGWLAWSDDEPENQQGRSWGSAWGHVAVILSCAVVAAVVVAMVCWLFVQQQHHDTPLVPIPSSPSTMPASDLPPIASEAPSSLPKVADPAPPVTTVTVTPRSAPSQADRDEQFLNDITSGGLNITDVREAIGGAHTICAYLTAGHTEADATRQAMRNNTSLGVDDARVVVGAAVRAYCPEQAD